ncbi:hypothetical protein O3M35_012842 [Rhynocoris fuscipes]|uniref:C2H2-type domain-containing protein n=1 Tax=Rhynocoris fuscipes TaxID=488301 RepID=A0AAW1CJM8_9HEMI
MSVSTTGDSEQRFKVSVEWEDESGEVKGKTVPIEDIFRRNPTTATISSELDHVPNSVTQPEENGNVFRGTTPCHICGLSFKNERGLRVHVGKKHPTEANNIKLATITGINPSPAPSKNDDPSIKDEIQRYTEYFRSLTVAQSEFNADDFDTNITEFLAFVRAANQALPGPKHPAARHFQQRRKDKFKMPSKVITNY